MYPYKHTLTREQIEQDLKPDNRGTRVMAAFMLFITVIGTLVVTLFIYLIGPDGFHVDEDSPGLHIAVGVVWVIAAAIMFLFGKIIVSTYKPPQIPDIYVTKRRLDTISREEYQYTSYAGGRANAVYCDVFYFEGMSKYFPTPTQLELAEEGDYYYVVTYGVDSTSPRLIYSAKAYIWNDTSET